MAITRVYTSEEDCARLWVNEAFDNVSDDLVLGQSDFWETWEFYEADDEGSGLVPCEPPMWGTYFHIADSCDYRWVESNIEAIARLGFTLIYEDGYLWGLGIDGAGYSFYEAHWVPLYRLRGFQWHLDS